MEASNQIDVSMQDDGQSLEAYDIGRKDRDQFNEVLEPLSPRNMQKGHAKPTSHVPRRRQKPPKASFPSQTWSNKHQHRGSSKFKGVSWSERSGKWRAQMWYGNKVPPAPRICSTQCPKQTVKRAINGP